MNFFYTRFDNLINHDNFMAWAFGADKQLKSGFTAQHFTAYYGYFDQDGNLLYFKPRFDNAQTGKKFIKPFHLDDNGNFAFGEPKHRYNANQKPLYNLPEIANAPPNSQIWLVEGEKCCDFLTAYGLLATTTGASSSVNTTDLTPLQGHQVILWRDNDLAGEKWLNLCTDALNGLGVDYRIIDLAGVANIAGVGLDDGFDCVDFLDLPMHNGKDMQEIKNLVLSLPMIEKQAFLQHTSTPAHHASTAPNGTPARQPNGTASNADDEKWGEIVPFASISNNETLFPLKAFPASLQTPIEKIAYYQQVPLSMAGFAVLSAVAHIGQGFMDASYIGQGSMPASLFLLIQAESGTGKSQTIKLANHAIKQHIQNQIEQYKKDLQEYKEQTANKNKKERDEYLNHHHKPIDPDNVFSSGTVQGVMTGFVDGSYTNASYTADEASAFFNGSSLKSETAKASVGEICSIYSDGKAERRLAGNADKPKTAYHCRLSMYLAGQPAVLKEVLENPELIEQGLLPRFLISIPQALGANRQLVTQNPYDDKDLQQYWQNLTHFLEMPTPKPKERQAMGWNTEALAKMREYWQINTAREADANLYKYRAFTRRLTENACRIASLFAWYNRNDVIRIDDAKGAILLAEYSLNEVRRYSDITTDTTDAEKVLEWLIKTAKKQKTGVLKLSEVQSNIPKSLRPKEILNPALELLNDNNYIFIAEVESYRRNIRIIEINPKLLG